MRTCRLSHQIMGPTIVKVAKTGFMRKIANLQLLVPKSYVITHKYSCQKSYISIIMTSTTWADPRCVQDAATFLGSQNRSQGRCVWQARASCRGTFANFAVL